MKLSDVYQKFSVPPNLQHHMLRVFGVICVINTGWVGEKLDWDLLKKLALIHDLGNIVKFNLQGEELALKDTQAKFIEKYGPDDHQATAAMLLELGFDELSIETVCQKSFANSVAIAESSNYLLKILYYADMRVIPNSVDTLEARIADINNRMPKYTSRSDFNDLVASCRRVEKQLQPKINFDLSLINEETIKLYFSKANYYEI